MKSLLLAGAFALSTTAAFAGGLHAPKSDPIVVPPEVVVKDTEANAGDHEWVGVLMTFLTIVVMGTGF